ncbi:MAG: S9 family peptidase [Gemmatimonadales bacterium]|nr:MAG: S9 family peptidase [Gemmatimonadales bacterium]
MRRRHFTAAALLLLVTAAPAAAQENPITSWVPEVARDHDFELSIANFTRGAEFLGQAPSSVSWTDNGEWVYFRWLPHGHEWHADAELWRVRGSGGEPELIDDPLVADSLALTFAGGDISPDGLLRVTAWRGDLWLVDRQTLERTRLTNTRQNQSQARFTGDGRGIFFNQGGQIHHMELETGRVTQLTDIQSGTGPSDPSEPEGQEAFLRDQQSELFQYIQRMQARREAQQEVAELRQEQQELRTVYAGRAGNPGGFQIDDHGRFVALSASRGAGNTERAGVPRWITEDGYTEFNPTRTKVGDAVGSSTVGIHAVGSDSIRWLEVQDFVDAWGAESDPHGGSALEPAQMEAMRDGEVEVQSVQFRGWNDAGTYGLVQANSLDNKHRWLMSVEAESGDLTMLHHVADSAWVGGPCGGCAGWLPDSDRAYWVNEASRFAQMYQANADGSDLERITEGDWEILSVGFPESRDHFVMRTNHGSPYSQHMYRMDFDGSNMTRITEGLGNFNGTLSPDGSRMAVVHSTQTRPPELYLMDNEPGAQMARVTTSPHADFLAFPWIDAEIVEFEARDGARVPARIYRPSDMGVESNGGAVLFVHGAGYLQNVHHWWSQYSREYMFHHFLAAQGFTVLDVDFRASAGYGRDWRTAIYRHMGGWDLTDYVDGVDYLVAEEGVDRGRIGIYGGSYGGFITLMALFTEPEVFHAGAALRSVTDWAHYNEGYTSNILNRPQDDPEAYRQSSPIYFAEGLQGHLLMNHPMYDTNVHFQDIVRLTQRLIELNKENWELAVYPTENHGMVDPNSWVDQLRRIYELFWSTLSAPGCTEGTGVCEVPVHQNP